jgi:hypothetical protein
MPKKQFNHWSQILLKYFTYPIRCHISTNNKMTCVTLNKKYKFIKLFFLKKKKKKRGEKMSCSHESNNRFENEIGKRWVENRFV